MQSKRPDVEAIRERAEEAVRTQGAFAGSSTGRDVLALLADRAALEAELRLAREEIRIREESQIPVIPRGAQAKIDRLEADRAAVVEAATPLARLPLPVSSDERVEWLTYQGKLIAALARLSSESPAACTDDRGCGETPCVCREEVAIDIDEMLLQDESDS